MLMKVGEFVTLSVGVYVCVNWPELNFEILLLRLPKCTKIRSIPKFPSIETHIVEWLRRNPEHFKNGMKCET